MKLSLLAFHWRIFNVASIRWLSWVLAIAVVGWLVARVCHQYVILLGILLYMDQSMICRISILLSSCIAF